MELSNIDDIILEIEDRDEASDRVIAYAEIILHLKYVKKIVGFNKTEDDWRNIINNSVNDATVAHIDKQIAKFTEMLKLNTK